MATKTKSTATSIKTARAKESATKSATKPTTKTAVKTAPKPAAKSAAKRVTKTTATPTAKTATKATTKTPSKTSAKTTTQARTNPAASKTIGQAPANKPTTLRGRSVFLVQTTQAGVVVRTAWLSEDKKLSDMPAVFPSVDYAVNLIDDLKRQVLKHFSQAAQVGAKAIAAKRNNKNSG